MKSAYLALVPLLAAAQTASAFVTAQYWPAYDGSSPANLAWSYTNIAYHFVTVTTPSGIELGSGETAAGVTQFVQQAKAHGTVPSFTVGGWDGGLYFSNFVKTAAGRTKFAQQLALYARRYGFAGIDIDWEYPNSQGIGCNTINAQDSANLLLFLKELRALVGTKMLLTAAVSTSGFIGPDGNVLANLAPYATYLDYINLMTYDVFGTWSPTTGPLSPLYECGNSAGTSVDAAVKLWTSRGFPAKKILLGIPAYAISFTTKSATLSTTTVGGSATKLYQPWNGVVPKGDSADSNAPATDVCGVKSAAYSGQFKYSELISEGRLNAAGTAGANGWTRYFDTCTQTPFLFNPSKKNWISYEDSQSVAAKAAYAKSHGLAGTMIFDSTGFTTPIYQTIKQQLTAKARREIPIDD
ncbi:glycoside hydrolase family 18 protein [Pseudohyphozyma bogoriensis]|nr:glycoside hydrolase family 18 protein [Pseudohyphozyma bogoriensis]